jgi:hypothetical protein
MQQEKPVVADLSTMPLSVLMEQCAEQQRVFRTKSGTPDDSICYELMRRGLAERNEEALAAFYNIFRPMVTRWVQQHSLFPSTGEDGDYFVNVTFSNFFNAASGEKFEKFAHLAGALAYLKTVVHTCILQYMRYFNQITDMTSTESDDAVSVPDTGNLEHELNNSDMWERIRRLLPDDDDYLLARLVFQLDKKPAEIAQEYPDKWSNPRLVSATLQRIRRILRTDRDLGDMLGGL